MSILGYLKESLSHQWDMTPDGDLKRVNINGVDFEYEVGEDGVYIEFIGVPVNLRGKGLARTILQSFLASVDEEGYPTTLMVLAGDDETSEDELIAFYRSLGFEPYGNDPGNNKVLMKRKGA